MKTTTNNNRVEHDVIARVVVSSDFRGVIIVPINVKDIEFRRQNRRLQSLAVCEDKK